MNSAGHSEEGKLNLTCSLPSNTEMMHEGQSPGAEARISTCNDRTDVEPHELYAGAFSADKNTVNALLLDPATKVFSTGSTGLKFSMILLGNHLTNN
jgi:hypothetical protein